MTSPPSGAPRAGGTSTSATRKSWCGVRRSNWARRTTCARCATACCAPRCCRRSPCPRPSSTASWRRSARVRPRMLFGYPSALSHIARHAKARGRAHGRSRHPGRLRHLRTPVRRAAPADFRHLRLPGRQRLRRPRRRLHRPPVPGRRHAPDGRRHHRRDPRRGRPAGAARRIGRDRRHPPGHRRLPVHPLPHRRRRRARHRRRAAAGAACRCSRKSRAAAPISWSPTTAP